jgi:hypothetical protein
MICLKQMKQTLLRAQLRPRSQTESLSAHGDHVTTSKLLDLQVRRSLAILVVRVFASRSLSI